MSLICYSLLPIKLTPQPQVHRDDGFELEEYAADDVKANQQDIENYPRGGTAVRLPAVASGTAISDDTSMHSRPSLDAK